MTLIGGHLSGLATFTGRENRKPFWLWMLIVWGVQFVVGMVVMIPLMASAFARIGELAQRDPDAVNQHPEAVQAAVLQAMGPMMRDAMAVSAIFMLVFLVLVAAAVTRRLHDGDRSGWWAAPVLALHLANLALTMQMMPKYFAAFSGMRPGMTPDQMNAAMAPMMQASQLTTAVGMVNPLLIVLLIVFLALPGTEGPNRYGADPLAGLRSPYPGYPPY